MPSEFASPSVKEEIKKKRFELCEIWADENILDCTAQAGELALLYLRLLGAHGKRMAFVGKCLFCWETDSDQILNFVVFEDQNTIVAYKLAILPDGKLELEDKVFQNPRDLLEVFTNQKHVVQKRVDIKPDTILGKVLFHRFDSSCLITFPEYPPLLVAIALANRDEKMANAILEHPFIDEPGNDLETKRKLFHVMPQAIQSSINFGRLEFLDYLIDKYDLFKPIWGDVEFMMVTAVRHDKTNIVKYLINKYPEEIRNKVLLKGLYTSAALGREKTFQLLLATLQNLPEDPTFNPSAFLANAYIYFGPYPMQEAVKKLGLAVDWVKWIEELINKRIDPRFFLEFYVKQGSSLSTLSQDLKNKIYLNALATEDAEAALDHIKLTHPELGPISREVIKGSFDNVEKLKILISTGLVPTKEDFEELLKAYQLGPERLKHFTVLLEGVKDPASAKSILKISSAFGLEAMNLVFDKFPELESDKSFLFGMLDETWKGTVQDIDALLGNFLTLKPKLAGFEKDLSKNKDNFELPVEQLIISQKTSQDIILKTLIFVLLPTHQLEKIQAILLQNHELIMEFWWKCIFNGPARFDHSGWPALAQATLPKLDQNQRAFLIRYAFQYGYPAFAEFLLAQGIPLPADKTVIMFHFAMQANEIRLIEILIEQGQKDRKDELDQSLLHHAVGKNHSAAVALLLKHGAQADAKDQKGHTPYMYAMQNNLVTICRLFAGDKAFSDLATHITGLEPPEMQKWLIKAFLNSSTKDIHSLMKYVESKIGELSVLDETKSAYQDILKYTENFIKTAGTLLVRLPNRDNQSEMYAAYGKPYQNYEEQQQKWGVFCDQWYTSVYKQMIEKKLSLIDVLQLFAKPRDDLESFQTIRTSNAFEVGLVTDLVGRYYPYWVLAQKIQREYHQNPSRYAAQIKDTEKGYQLLATVKDNVIIELTKIETRIPFEKGRFKGTLVHSGVQSIKIILPYLADKFEEIKNYPSNSDDETLPEELKRKIAYFFWLGCHVTPAERGSSQYMVMLHRMVYQMHGFQTAPWSQQFPFPDCVALVMPFEIFYTQYYDSLMESPPKKSINL